MGAPAAIARAVEDALSSYGVRIDGVPIPPSRLRDLIRDAETSRQRARK
jgi:CO/xanthine dehydrogenase Mo-binding subunit